MKIEFMNAFKAPVSVKEKVFFGISLGVAAVGAAANVATACINRNTQKALIKANKLNANEIKAVVAETLNQLVASEEADEAKASEGEKHE